MIRVSIIKRWKGNKPAIQSESSKSSVPTTFIKRLTKKKNLKEVVYEKKKSDLILNEGEARSRDYRNVHLYSVISEFKKRSYLSQRSNVPNSISIINIMCNQFGLRIL